MIELEQDIAGPHSRADVDLELIDARANPRHDGHFAFGLDWRGENQLAGQITTNRLAHTDRAGAGTGRRRVVGRRWLGRHR